MTHGVTGENNPGTDSGIESAETETDIDPDEIAAGLTKFQIRCLAAIAQQDRYGLGLKREIETYYGEEQNHGRLFPNLDELVDLGLIEKGQRDKRTNNYSITSKGDAVLEYELGWLEEQINGGDKQ